MAATCRIMARMKARHVYATISLVIVLVCVVGYLAQRSLKPVYDSYALWWVADMVVEHMDTNNGVWPNGWDALRDDHQAFVDRNSGPWSFDFLRERVEVDWDADPQQLLIDSEDSQVAEFRVIRLRDGTDAHWESHEPNQIVLDYLRSRDGLLHPPAQP